MVTKEVLVKVYKRTCECGASFIVEGPKSTKLHCGCRRIKGCSPGARYGRLLVTERIKDQVSVTCDCGQKTVVRPDNLICGRTKSCGCLRSLSVGDMAKRFWLEGQRFGRLVAKQKMSGSHPGKGCQWKCVCDCGGEKITWSNYLRSGSTLSCGCARRSKKGFG